jgi:hypothetical protein
MIKKISRYFLAVLSVVSISAVFAPGVSMAACTNIASNLQAGVNSTGATGSCGSSGTLTGGIKNVAKTITVDFSIVIGAISVIMIIYAGFRYITSGGSSEHANSARNILMYAVIGLIIAVIAQLIVHLVINAASGIKGQ